MAIESIPAADWLNGIGTALLISGALGGLAFGLHLLRPPILRRRLRSLIAERPGVDPSDPALHSRIVMTFAEHGFVTDGEGSHTVVSSTAVKSFGEPSFILTLMVGRINGFIIPKRDLTEDELAVIRVTVSRWLGHQGPNPISGLRRSDSPDSLPV